MKETENRPNESVELYGGFKQHDRVEGVFNGRVFEGEIKSFTKFLDTGEAAANIASMPADVHVPGEVLKFKMRPGQVENPKFKPGRI